MAGKHTEGGEIIATTSDGQTVQGTQVTVETTRDYDPVALAIPIINIGELLSSHTERTEYVRDSSGNLHEVDEVVSRKK